MMNFMKVSAVELILDSQVCDTMPAGSTIFKKG